MKRAIVSALASALILSFPSVAFASGRMPASPSEDNALRAASAALTEYDKLEMGGWVSYDEGNNQFLIKDGAEAALGANDYARLNQCIEVTNSNLSRADLSSGDVSVVVPEKESSYPSSLISTRKYSEGVTKIDFHWWGASIYLSRSTIRAIGTGVTIGGILVPQPVVSKVLAVAGVVIDTCPGGIAFDYNYVAAGIGALGFGGVVLPIAFSNVRWQ